MNKLQEDIETTVHSLLLILKQLGGTADFHKVFKILYFADQKHLVKFGTPITSEKYIAMQNGPVPSVAYDILKALRGEGLLWSQRDSFSPYFSVENGFLVSAKVEPDLDNLSDSEVLTILESIKENKSKRFSSLTQKSHDDAWSKALRDGEMEVLDIAKAGGANKEMIKYIKLSQENQLANFE